jgi:hypothetical protein
MKNLRDQCLLCLLTLLTAFFLHANVSAQSRPNIVFILTDDQGWGDLSLHGNTNVRTPNMTLCQLFQHHA